MTTFQEYLQQHGHTFDNQLQQHGYTFDDLAREREYVRAYLEGARLYHKHSKILGVAGSLMLLLLGLVVGLAAPVAYDLLMGAGQVSPHGVMDGE